MRNTWKMWALANESQSMFWKTSQPAKPLRPYRVAVSLPAARIMAGMRRAARVPKDAASRARRQSPHGAEHYPGAHRQQRGADEGDDVAGAPARPQDGHLLEELRLLLRPLVDQPLDGDRGQPVAPPDHHPERALAQLHLSAILIELDLQHGGRKVSTSKRFTEPVSNESHQVQLPGYKTCCNAKQRLDCCSDRMPWQAPGAVPRTGLGTGTGRA